MLDCEGCDVAKMLPAVAEGLAAKGLLVAAVVELKALAVVELKALAVDVGAFEPKMPDEVVVELNALVAGVVEPNAGEPKVLVVVAPKPELELA